MYTLEKIRLFNLDVLNPMYKEKYKDKKDVNNSKSKKCWNFSWTREKYKIVIKI